jgi:hypothetical protein
MINIQRSIFNSQVKAALLRSLRNTPHSLRYIKDRKTNCKKKIVVMLTKTLQVKNVLHGENTFLIVKEFCCQHSTCSKPLPVVRGVNDLYIINV